MRCIWSSLLCVTRFLFLFFSEYVYIIPIVFAYYGIFIYHYSTLCFRYVGPRKPWDDLDS